MRCDFRHRNALLIFCLASGLSMCPIAAWERSRAHVLLTGEFIYMGRAQVHNHTLVKDSDKPQSACKCPNFEVIDNHGLVNRMTFEPGIKVGMAYLPNRQRSFELNFLLLNALHAEKEVKGERSLSFPFSHHDYDLNFYHADEAKATYRMTFWDVELNYWRHFTPRDVNYFALSGIIGLRYFQWNERFKLAMTTPPDTSDYRIHTQNDLYSAQLGLALQINPLRWMSWDFMAKVGALGNDAHQHTFLGANDNDTTLRNFTAGTWTLGMFTDLAATLGFSFKNHYNVHVGYQFLFFSGLALAPEQIDKSTDKSVNHKVYTGGTGIIHGLVAGLTFRF